MGTGFLQHRRRAIGTAAFCALLLTACGKPAPSEGPADLPPPPAPSDVAPGEVPPPDESPAAPAQPAPEAPPPTDPSPAPNPTAAANQPALDTMQLALPAARSSAKMSVPVDLRYRFDGEPLENQPVTLHLAAVPRVAGSNLNVSFKKVQGIDVAAGATLNARKASANSDYRQQYSVTRQASAPSEIRVLITMDLPEGQAFGFFSVPFEAGPAPRKQDSVKPR
jgi:hypothetical protein